jgi:hypothetical protein
MTIYRLVAFTNAEPQREAEYNNWYDNRHLPDVLRVPGFVGAQRFRASPVGDARQPPKYQYLTLYEIDTNNIDAVMDALAKVVGTDAMPLSSALSPDRVSYLYEPLIDRVTGEGATDEQVCCK